MGDVRGHPVSDGTVFPALHTLALLLGALSAQVRKPRLPGKHLLRAFAPAVLFLTTCGPRTQPSLVWNLSLLLQQQGWPAGHLVLSGLWSDLRPQIRTRPSFSRGDEARLFSKRCQSLFLEMGISLCCAYWPGTPPASASPRTEIIGANCCTKLMFHFVDLSFHIRVVSS